MPPSFRTHMFVDACRPTTTIDRIFLCTTDKGSNEAWARRCISGETSDIPNVFFFDNDCLEHAPHLVVMSSLLLCDELLAMHDCKWKYWTSLAMFSHTARDVAKTLHECWARLFGSMSAKEKTKALFPRAVSQRWGRVHELEKRVLSAGVDKLAICLADVLTHKAIDTTEVEHICAAVSPEDNNTRGKYQEALQKIQQTVRVAKAAKTTTKSKATKTSHTPNELEVEQTKAYSTKMSQWRGRTLLAMSDHLWGRVMEVMHRTREPIIHLSNFIKRPVSDDEFTRKGGVLAQLVTGRAQFIHEEFIDIARGLSLSCIQMCSVLVSPMLSDCNVTLHSCFMYWIL